MSSKVEVMTVRTFSGRQERMDSTMWTGWLKKHGQANRDRFTIWKTYGFDEIVLFADEEPDDFDQASMQQEDT